jgi:hypothetical protein
VVLALYLAIGKHAKHSQNPNCWSEAQKQM